MFEKHAAFDTYIAFLYFLLSLIDYEMWEEIRTEFIFMFS